MNKVIYRGAEAVLYLEDDYLVKERISKGYRHKVIDVNKRKYPTRKEHKLLLKAKKLGANVPEVLMFDDVNMKIVMEHVDGDVLKDALNRYGKEKREKISKLIGEQVALIHDGDIIHGDLTTSNMVLSKGKVYFVDFGLGGVSLKVEDKAVDVHLFKQALESRHFDHVKGIYSNFLKGYSKSKNYKNILERLDKVEARGRYKRKNK